METKSSLPHDLIQDKDLSSTVEAYFEFNHLKQLYRQGWLQNGMPSQQCESVAEHSFSAALLTLFLVDSHVPKLDKWKVLCMALLHDLGEVHAGDFTPRDNVTPQEKFRLEQQSVQKILSKLPEGSTYIALWEEYAAGESPEAKFVREIDRLEMGLQASVYQQQGLV